MDKYKIIETIGDGTYGNVYKAINTNSNTLVAIKKMKKKYYKWQDCQNLSEVKALTNLSHCNIVQLNELIMTKSELYMIFDYMGINLYEWTKQNETISEGTIRNIVFQILQGLTYMHRQNYFHRDMKPENILVNQSIVKIADFGLAKEVRSRIPFTEYVATRWYRAPEIILKSQSYSSPIDIFAVGAIMAELYNNKPLFPGKNEMDQIRKICEVLGTPLPSEWSEGYVLASRLSYKFPSYKGTRLKVLIPKASENAINLMESMLHFNPTKRLTASQCLQHPFFQCFDMLSLYGLKLNNSIHSLEYTKCLNSSHMNTNAYSNVNKKKPNTRGSNKILSYQKKTSTNNNSVYEGSIVSNVYSLMNLKKLGSIGEGKEKSLVKASRIKFEDFLNSKNI